MIRLIRRFTVASIVILALLIIIARAIGSTNKPLALAFLDPGNCPQPCLHGILSGVTTEYDAISILNADPMLEKADYIQAVIGCWQDVSNIWWHICLMPLTTSQKSTYYVQVSLSVNALRFGDVIDTLGEPTGTYYCSIAGPKIPIWAIFLTFRGNISVFARTSGDLRNLRIDPSAEVEQLIYFPPNYDLGTQKTWSGFSKFSENRSDC